jgi:hypothetical protein
MLIHSALVVRLTVEARWKHAIREILGLGR